MSTTNGVKESVSAAILAKSLSINGSRAMPEPFATRGTILYATAANTIDNAACWCSENAMTMNRIVIAERNFCLLRGVKIPW